MALSERIGSWLSESDVEETSDECSVCGKPLGEDDAVRCHQCRTELSEFGGGVVNVEHGW